MNNLSKHIRPGVSPGSLIFLFFLWLGCCQPGYSAAEAQAGVAVMPAGKRFATVWRIRGEVSATGSSDRLARPLREGDPVYVGDRLRSTGLAEAILKTEDAGVLAIRPNTEFIVERFVAEDRPTDSSILRLLVGSMRIVSGWIAHTHRAGNLVVTATSTVGIRGTDHEPYVVSAALAATTAHLAGTYDKVNRGATTLQVGTHSLDVDSGRVGFVRAAPGDGKKRALMSLLMPVLLDKVPSFYVPGVFEDEMNKLSAAAEEESMRQLEERRKLASAQPQPQSSLTGIAPGIATSASAPAAGTVAGALVASVAQGVPGECSATEVATNWLGHLDLAVSKRNPQSLLRLFGPEVVVQATVRNTDGRTTTLDFNRQEFAKSTMIALKGITDYQQRRLSIEGWPQQPGQCERINVKSVVIEQGQQNGQRYRFESVETYVLERRADTWQAITATSTQQ